MVKDVTKSGFEGFRDTLRVLDSAVKRQQEEEIIRQEAEARRSELPLADRVQIVDMPRQPSRFDQFGNAMYDRVARAARYTKLEASARYYGAANTNYTVEEALDRLLAAIPDNIAAGEFGQLPDTIMLDPKTLQLLNNLLNGNYSNPSIKKKIAEIPEYSRDKLARKVEYLGNYLRNYSDVESQLEISNVNNDGAESSVGAQNDAVSANDSYLNTALSAVTGYRSTIDYMLLKSAPIAFGLYVVAIMQELDPSVRELFYPRDSSYDPIKEIGKGNIKEIAIQAATLAAMLLAISNKKIYPYFRQKVTSNAFELSRMENPVRILLAAAAAAWTSGINSFAPYSGAIRSENPTLLSEFYQKCGIPTRLLGGTLFAGHFWILQNLYLATSLHTVTEGLNLKEYYSPFTHSAKPEMVRLRDALGNDQTKLDELDSKFRKCLLANAPLSVVLSNIARLIFNAVQYDRKNGSTDEAISLTGALMSIIPSLVMTFFALDGAVRASQTFSLNGVMSEIKGLYKSPAFITNSAFLAVLFSSTLHKSETFSSNAFAPVALLSSFLYFVNSAEAGKLIPAVNNKIKALGEDPNQVVVANENRRLTLLEVLKETSPKAKKPEVVNQNGPSASVQSPELQRKSRVVKT